MNVEFKCVKCQQRNIKRYSMTHIRSRMIRLFDLFASICLRKKFFFPILWVYKFFFFSGAEYSLLCFALFYFFFLEFTFFDRFITTERKKNQKQWNIYDREPWSMLMNDFSLECIFLFLLIFKKFFIPQILFYFFYSTVIPFNFFCLHRFHRGCLVYK